MVAIMVFAGKGFVIAATFLVIALEGVFLIRVDVLVMAFEVGGSREYCLLAFATPRILAWVGSFPWLFWVV